MSTGQAEYAELDTSQLDRLRHLEGELSTLLVAVNPAAAAQPMTNQQVKRLRTMPVEQLATLQRAESELGVVLLAYTPH